MAFVLKPARGPSKGVVVFTHKERHLLDLGAPLIGPELKRMRERYFVLMHWGWFMKDAPSFPAVDAHLCRDSAVTFRDPSVQRIAMNSAMFTPAYFRVQAGIKQWDVVSVTRALRQKRTGELLDCLRLVMDARPETTALVVCAGPENQRSRRYENDLYDRYLGMFSDAERDRFTFLYTRSSIPFLLPRRDIAFLYNSSRVFTLFSDIEGESRVIKEALMCGLPVLVKQHLLGGGRDFLNDANSRQFSNAKDGAERLLEMLREPQRFSVDTAALADQIGEEANIPRFERAIAAVYERAGLAFDGGLDTEDLSRKLPGHVALLPRSMRSDNSDDLRSAEAALRFIRGLADGVDFEDVTISPQARVVLRAFDRTSTLRTYVERARRRLHLA